MTLAELSTYLHMGRNTVLKLVDDKKIPGLKSVSYTHLTLPTSDLV